MILAKWDQIEYFRPAEFACRCCTRVSMGHDFMMKLDDLRREIGPIVVTSGYRCPEHNDQVSTTGRHGPHTTGKAADLAIERQRARKALVPISLKFEGIGLKQHGDGRFIHVDDCGQRIWTYR